MARIPDEIIQRVRDRVDIVDLVGRFVGLKSAGRNHKGLCPFHQEKTPSFVVTPDRQTFKCFGCGVGGNAFDFLMRMENLTFPEAVRALAAQHGIEVPESGGGEGVEALREANEAAQACFRAGLAASGSPGARYLAQRGLDPALIERFGVGYAADRWDGVAEALRQRGIPARVGERAGLLKEGRSGSHYDLLRGRVTFPIRDARGRIVAFGGRAVAPDQEPKYLNSPESPIFRKREAFFGLPLALEPIRREGRAVVVEGYFDLLAVHRAGIHGVVATCGTALTEAHAQNLRRRTREVVLLFDGDEAGQKAMERSLDVLLPAGLRVRAALLPQGDDPDSLLARDGDAALRERVEAAPPALEVSIRRAVARGCATPAEKADAVASVAAQLLKVESPVERGAYEERLALAVGANVEDVRAAVRAQRRGEDALEEIRVQPRVEPAEVRKLRQLARSLVEHPHLAPRVDHERLSGIEDHPVVELIRQLVAAAGEDRRVDLEELSARLSEPARQLLYALVAEDHVPEPEAAEKLVVDTNRWLERRELRAAQAALTERLRSGAADPLAILRAKQARGGAGAHSPPREKTH